MSNEDGRLPGGSNRKRKKNAGRSQDAARSSTSQQETKELPGFVYDPVTRRYFRLSDHGPNNNFTVSTGRLLARHREAIRRSELWIDTAVSNASFLTQSALLHSVYCPSSLPNPSISRRKLAAFQHRYLAGLRSVSAVKVPYPLATDISANGELIDFDCVEEPKLLMAAGNISANEWSETPVNLSLRTLRWVKEKRKSKPKLTYKSCKDIFLQQTMMPLPDITGIKLEKVKLLPGNSDDVLMLCEIKSTQDHPVLVLPGRLLRVSETAHVQLVGSFPHVQRICSVSTGQDPIVASATSDSGEVHLTRLQDSAMKKITFSGVITCLDFSPSNTNVFFAGNTISQVLRMDIRQTKHSSSFLTSANSWKQFDVSGHCVVTNVKLLQDGHRFITTIAALPQQVPKMLLWDSRNLRSPVTLYEDTFSPFNRKPSALSFSFSQTLVAASDAEGVTRFWDVNSGCILARLPPPAALSLEKIGKCPPVSLICGNSNGDNAVLQVILGRSPSVHVFNLEQ